MVEKLFFPDTCSQVQIPVMSKTIARALKPCAASRGFPVRNEPDMIPHPGGMRPRSPQLAAG